MKQHWNAGPDGGGKPADAPPDVKPDGRSDYGELPGGRAKHGWGKGA